MFFLSSKSIYFTTYICYSQDLIIIPFNNGIVLILANIINYYVTHNITLYYVCTGILA